MDTMSILVSPTLASPGPYLAGDYVGPGGAVGITVPGAAAIANGGGTIQSLLVIDQDNQGAQMDLYAFVASAWNPPADNAPWSLTDASAALCCGMVSVNSYINYGNGQWGFATFPYGAIPFTADGTNLYLGIVLRGPATYTAGGLKLRLGVYRDTP